MIRSRIAIVLIALTAGAISSFMRAGPAWAQPVEPSEERARALHEKGLKHYDMGEYDQAIAAYREAYALVPAPGILFNLAQALRLSGDCAQARQVYKSYLRGQPDADNADIVRSLISDMDKCVASGSRPGGTRPGSSDSSSGELDLTTSATADDRAGRGKRWTGLGLGAVGAGLVATGIYYGLEARSASRSLDDRFANGGQWDDDAIALEARGQRDNRRAIALTSIGVGAAVGGAVLYYLGHRDRDESQRLSLAPIPSGGATVSWQLAF